MSFGIVIVENRKELIQGIIDSHLPFLPNDTPIYIHSVPESSTIYGYNRILTNYEFWESLPFEKILICQHDSGLLRIGIEKFLNFDYVGSPFAFQYHGGNGGLSIRSKSIMKFICQSTPVYCGEQMHGNEDVFFSNIMHDKKMGVLAPKNICDEFSVESIFKLGTLGYHAIQKYHAPEKCEEILNQYKYEET